MDRTERRDTIRVELERRAKARQTIRYGEVANMVGMAANGLGPDLDAIKAYEAQRCRPDLSCLVVNSKTGLPGYVKTEADRANAMRVREDVFDAWGSSGEG